MGSIATTAANKLSADVLLQMAKTRRSVYPLNKMLPITTTRINELVRETTLHTPSSFNSQSNRVVVLHGPDHDKFWTITEDVLRGIVPADSWKHTGDRMAMFRAAAGTVLFFDDGDSVKGMQDRFPTYADKFPVFAAQSNAMQQWLLWTALAVEGVGASLQHYGNLIEERVVEAWSLPATWTLNAQLVFGGKDAEPGEKEFKPVDERVKVFGA